MKWIILVLECIDVVSAGSVQLGNWCDFLIEDLFSGYIFDFKINETTLSLTRKNVKQKWHINVVF